MFVDELVNVTVENLDNVCFKMSSLLSISDVFFDSPLNTDTRKIRTLWLVLFVSILIRVPLFLFLAT